MYGIHIRDAFYYIFLIASTRACLTCGGPLLVALSPRNVRRKRTGDVIKAPAYENVVVHGDTGRQNEHADTNA